MDRQKLIHQLFIGKVADVLGMEKTTELGYPIIPYFLDILNEYVLQKT